MRPFEGALQNSFLRPPTLDVHSPSQFLDKLTCMLICEGLLHCLNCIIPSLSCCLHFTFKIGDHAVTRLQGLALWLFRLGGPLHCIQLLLQLFDLNKLKLVGSDIIDDCTAMPFC
jgi:hypothetical protein